MINPIASPDVNAFKAAPITFATGAVSDIWNAVPSYVNSGLLWAAVAAFTLFGLGTAISIAWAAYKQATGQ